ncbi:hypothetical protein [Variovorax sp. AFSI2.2]|uniref:hypothetical protein n=1 Tax=Variovorax sp. AFSI2.2 TaxID=3384160 RepID=UPI003EB84D7A
MGSITKRKRADGSVAHMARIRIREDGVVIHTETETFDREPAAKLWMKNREIDLAKPGALEKLRAPDPTFAEAIEPAREAPHPAGSGYVSERSTRRRTPHPVPDHLQRPAHSPGFVEHPVDFCVAIFGDARHDGCSGDVVLAGRVQCWRNLRFDETGRFQDAHMLDVFGSRHHLGQCDVLQA